MFLAFSQALVVALNFLDVFRGINFFNGLQENIEIIIQHFRAVYRLWAVQQEQGFIAGLGH